MANIKPVECMPPCRDIIFVVLVCIMFGDVVVSLPWDEFPCDDCNGTVPNMSVGIIASILSAMVDISAEIKER